MKPLGEIGKGSRMKSWHQLRAMIAWTVILIAAGIGGWWFGWYILGPAISVTPTPVDLR